MKFEIYKTTKNKDLLLIQNFKYNLWRQNSNGSYYFKCRHDNCTASIILDECKENIIKIGRSKLIENLELTINQSHNHEANTQVQIESFKAIQRLKETMKKSSRGSALQHYCDERSNLIKIIQNVNSFESESLSESILAEQNIEEVVDNFPQFDQIKTALYSKRSEFFPKNPKSLEELFIDANSSFSLTELGQRFLLKDIKHETGQRMLIFASKHGLRTLARSKRWHADGTFNSSPILFEQHYIIHSQYKGIFIYIYIQICIYSSINNIQNI
jgi:hypothetical protein